MSAEALRLIALEDARQSKLHELLETIREQIRLGVPVEHRPDGLFQNIQDAVYAMRGRTPLMNDVVITTALTINRIDTTDGGIPVPNICDVCDGMGRRRAGQICTYCNDGVPA